jgi:hypothetical protein
MLVHKKVTKEHDTPYRLFLAFLALMGGKRKLAKTGSNRRLPKTPIKIALLGMAAGLMWRMR